MCGRFARINNAKEIKEIFNLDQIEIELGPSYNIAPTQDVAVILEKGQSKLTSMGWGLIPFWAKDIAIGSKLINARAETIDEKPSFKYSFQKRRCLIIANGFYEWQKRGSNKFPYFIHLKDNKPFCFAGIYDNWKSPDGDKITSCSIITTDATKNLRTIHPRMPVILSESNLSLWFNNSDTNALKQLLIPYSKEKIEFYEVARDVNSTANNYPELIAPSNVIF